MDAQYAIIGGGVVGLSIAWGLLKRGKSVIILDGEDNALRASRGNFGLVWVQSKGIKQPRYAQWTQSSAKAWQGFADELKNHTGVDVSLEQKGGYDLHFSEETLAARVADYNTLKEKIGGDYPFDVLGHNALHKEEPNIGPDVVGAILHHQDGHVNPLKLLRSLAEDVRLQGGKVLNNEKVSDIRHSDMFYVTCEDGTKISAEKLVLAAGLGSRELGPKLGFVAPLRPQRGQVLITEKMPKLINRPSLIARQVNEGGIQIGATNEEVGFNDRVTPAGLSYLAQEAIRAFPAIGRAQLVRTWGALRVLSPDGFPIYQQSPEYPGAFLVSCHSGVSLAAAHALLLPDWLEQTDAAPDLEVFSEKRFQV